MHEKKSLSPSSPLNRSKKKKKLSKTLRAYNSQMHERILLKFCMWRAEGGGHLCNDIDSSLQGSMELRTYMWKSCFSSSCHDVACQLTWLHDTLPCVSISSAAKNCATPRRPLWKKMWDPRWQPRIGCEGRLMANF